jgi:glycosyltransferase involved in cell wall biosynthesis
LAQDEVLREEYSCRGIRYPGIDPWTIERELAEYDSSDAICVPSEFVYRSFVEKGIPSYKLWKNSFGVDLTMFRSIPKEDEVFRVIFVGSLSVRKGVAYLLEAIRSLALPNCDLWLIGEAQAELTSILKNHEEDFRGIGVVPISELYKFYSQGSVFVLPSIEEGLSLVLAQAMACGLPVIATTNSGAEDLYNDGIEGFIVEPRNARAIAEKIEFLYRNPNVREVMGRAALQRVKALNGWNQYGARALEMYKEILDSRCSEPSRFPPIAACSVSR